VVESGVEEGRFWGEGGGGEVDVDAAARYIIFMGE
jgi:hypothetical protein